MSDFYDSLEDEGNEGKNSSGSVDRFSCDLSNDNTPSQSDSNAEDSDSHKTFNIDICLGKPKTTLIPKSQTNRSLKKVTRNEDIFFPRIVKTREIKGTKANSSNNKLDNEFLYKQGLQLNKDGSITKSPRTDVEELPFVTREYRSAVFQNKKSTEVKKRAPPSKVNRKNIFTFKENSENEISMLAIINARKKKGSSEELLTSGGSRCSSKESGSNLHKEFDNLTDTMKELILRKQNESSAEKPMEKAKTAIKEILSKTETKPKTQQIKIFSRRSDLDFKFGRTNLSYVERRQKEKGYNPLSLRMDSKKSPSETTRSNFGDAITDRLSDISSRIPTINYVDDEDEVKFYEKIIEMDKNRGLSRSTRSETPVGCRKIKEVDGYSSFKDQGEFKSKRKINCKSKGFGKSTSIDFPQEDCSKNCCKRNFHLCPTESSKAMSKVGLMETSVIIGVVKRLSQTKSIQSTRRNSQNNNENTELILKARAYGSMANARNLFKLKTQSENKINQNDVQKAKFSRNFGTDGDKKNGMLSREKLKHSRSYSKSSRSLNKAKSLTSQEDSPNTFLLPHISCSEKDKALKPEVFRKTTSCLDSSYTESNHVSLPNLVKEVFGNNKQ